jgi:hypothetical protein
MIRRRRSDASPTPKYALPAHCWTHTTHNVGALVLGFQTSCRVVCTSTNLSLTQVPKAHGNSQETGANQQQCGLLDKPSNQAAATHQGY